MQKVRPMRFNAALRQVEVLMPNKAYAVTVVVTKEADPTITLEGTIPGGLLETSIGEVTSFVEDRLNVEYELAVEEEWQTR